MATSLTSDSVHDFPCTSCAEDDINKEADVLCLTCNHYLCKICLKFHNRMAGGKDHQFIDKEEFEQASTASSQRGKPDLPTEICTKHHGKLIDMFCEDHDDVGCSVCMALDHRACKDMSYIPDIATSRITDETVQNAEKDLSEHLDKVKTLRDDRHKQKSRLSNETDLALESVKERRKKIDEYLDKHENVICKNISDKYEQFCENLDFDVNKCDDTITVLEKMSTQLLVESDTSSVSQTFVNIKVVQRTVKEAEKGWKASSDTKNYLPKTTFQTGNEISDILNPETVFGRVVEENEPPTGLSRVENVNIRHPEDKNTCDCNDLCQLPNGTFILTDYNNSNIKSLEYDTTYKLSGQLSMSSPPYGLCTVNEDEVVVTMPLTTTVAYVSVGRGLAIKKFFKVTGNCSLICHVDGRLYISNRWNANVCIYDLEFNYLQSISTDQAGSALYEMPTHLCLLPGKQQIVVADQANGIVVTDLAGKLIAKYKYQNRNVIGVCFDDGGHLFIADFKTKEILAIGVDKFSGTTLTSFDRKPQAVFFQSNTRRLYVCFDQSDDIEVFSVVY